MSLKEVVSLHNRLYFCFICTKYWICSNDLRLLLLLFLLLGCTFQNQTLRLVGESKKSKKIIYLKLYVPQRAKHVLLTSFFYLVPVFRFLRTARSASIVDAWPMMLLTWQFDIFTWPFLEETLSRSFSPKKNSYCRRLQRTTRAALQCPLSRMCRRCHRRAHNAAPAPPPYSLFLALPRWHCYWRSPSLAAVLLPEVAIDVAGGVVGAPSSPPKAAGVTNVLRTDAALQAAHLSLPPDVASGVEESKVCLALGAASAGLLWLRRFSRSRQASVHINTRKPSLSMRD
jgi:hypothetical protein